jgi:hypothetical protein
LVLGLALGVFIACNENTVRESGVHSDQTLAYVREYIIASDGRKVAHGSHKTWHADGSRRSLEFYEYGVRQGYAFAWDESGTLVSLRACEVGVCEDRAVPVQDRAPATVLAGGRFD